jgi:hypothetical protein
MEGGPDFQVASFLLPPSEEGGPVQYEQQAVKKGKTKAQRKTKAKRPSMRAQEVPSPSFENLRDLPAFADNHEFYVLGATLTRDHRLGQLLVDTFFMGTKVRATRHIPKYPHRVRRTCHVQIHTGSKQARSVSP